MIEGIYPKIFNFVDMDNLDSVINIIIKNIMFWIVVNMV